MAAIPSPTGEYPWLVYPMGDSQLFCPVSSLKSNNFSITRTVTALSGGGGALILSTCFFDNSFYHLIKVSEWVLRIWNQKTQVSVFLPLLEESYSNFNRSVLWIKPGEALEGTCTGFVLLFHGVSQKLSFCNIYYADDEEGFQTGESWQEIDYSGRMKELFEGEEDDDSGILDYPVLFENEVYSLYSNYNIVVIKIDTIGNLFIERTQHMRPQPQQQKYCNCYFHFFESFGELVAVYIWLQVQGNRNYKFKGAEIYKLNRNSGNWSIVDGDGGFLRNRAIFLHTDQCLSWVTNSEEDNGRIFFTIYKDRRLFSYSLRDCCLSYTLPTRQLRHGWKSPYVIPQANSTTNDSAATAEV